MQVLEPSGADKPMIMQIWDDNHILVQPRTTCPPVSEWIISPLQRPHQNPRQQSIVSPHVSNRLKSQTKL